MFSSKLRRDLDLSSSDRFEVELISRPRPSSIYVDVDDSESSEQAVLAARDRASSDEKSQSEAEEIGSDNDELSTINFQEIQILAAASRDRRIDIQPSPESSPLAPPPAPPLEPRLSTTEKRIVGSLTFLAAGYSGAIDAEKTIYSMQDLYLIEHLPPDQRNIISLIVGIGDGWASFNSEANAFYHHVSGLVKQLKKRLGINPVEPVAVPLNPLNLRSPRESYSTSGESIERQIEPQAEPQNPSPTIEPGSSFGYTSYCSIDFAYLSLAFTISIDSALASAAKTAKGLAEGGAEHGKIFFLSLVSFLATLFYNGPANVTAMDNTYIWMNNSEPKNTPTEEESVPFHIVALIVGWIIGVFGSLLDGLEAAASIIKNWSIEKAKAIWTVIVLSSLSVWSNLLFDGYNGVAIINTFIRHLQNKYGWIPRRETPDLAQVAQLIYDLSLFSTSFYAAAALGLADKNYDFTALDEIAIKLGSDKVPWPLITLLGIMSVLRDLLLKTNALMVFEDKAIDGGLYLFNRLNSCCANPRVEYTPIDSAVDNAPVAMASTVNPSLPAPIATPIPVYPGSQGSAYTNPASCLFFGVGGAISASQQLAPQRSPSPGR